MLMIASICMFVATAILAVGTCFTKKNKLLHFVLQTLSLIALLGTGIVTANVNNDFSGYSILIILSVAPQFLNLFNLKDYIDDKNTPTEELADFSESTKEESEESEEKEEPKETLKQKFLKSNGLTLTSFSQFASAICIALAALYLGKESLYSFLIGLAVALALTFVTLAIKENLNLFDLISHFLLFFSIGLMLGQIAAVLIYSFDVTNLIFCGGALFFAGFSALKLYVKSNFDELLYFLAMLCLFATLLV